MATQYLALERGGEKRLELSWGFNWRDFKIKLDGNVVGEITGGLPALKEGRSVTLPDGSLLRVGMQPQPIGVLMLNVTRDGKVLPGSATDPRIRLRNTAWILYAIAAALIVIGTLLALSTPQTASQPAAEAWLTPVLGVVFGVLGYFVSRRSTAALFAAIGIFALTIVVSLFQSTDESTVWRIIRIVGSIPVLLLLWQGRSAIKELNEEAPNGSR